MDTDGGSGHQEAEDEIAGEVEGGASPRPRPVSSFAAVENPEPLHRVVRSWAWGPWLLVALVALRLLAVAGMRAYLYVDSGEYDRIDFGGSWRRPWATPLLYWLIPGDDRWIPAGQAVLGAACWGVLALSAAAWFRLRSMQLVVAVVLAALGCTTVVTNWDASKLSESLGLSLTALVIGTWLNFLRRTEIVTAVALVAATVPWLFVRQSLIPTAWLIVVLAAAGALVAWRRGHARSGVRLLAGVAMSLAVITAIASATYSRNQEIVQENLRVIVSNRVASDPARLAWFTDNGMPVPASGDLGPDSLRDDPAFTRWVGGEGRGTYLEYLVTHPWYTLTEPLDDFVGLRPASAEEAEPQIAMLAPPDSYASIRPVLPEAAELLLFQPGDTGAVVFGMVVVLGWSLAWARRRSMRWTVPLLLVALSFASLYAGWHGATPELGRLALVGAVALRIGLLLQLAFLVEDAVANRRGRPRPGAR